MRSNIIIELLKVLRPEVSAMRSDMHADFKDIKARFNHLGGLDGWGGRDSPPSAEECARK